MSKSKGVLILLFTLMATMFLAMGYAVFHTYATKPKFAEGGFILVYDESNEESGMKPVMFNAGTSYSYKYPNNITFTDAEGKKVVASADSFVHYNSGAVTSIKDSVLVDLKEVEADVVNYYGLTSETSVDKVGKSYQIASQNGNIALDEMLWKIGENRYILLADEIYVSLAGGAEYTYDDFIELYYYESGMLSIISESGMIKTATSDCYISTGGNYKINASNKTILADDEVKMSMSQMVSNSDQNINILPAGINEIEIRVPEFNFTVIDGINGDAGVDGVAGINGINGNNGIGGDDGLDGENGKNGEKGVSGDNGSAGKVGTNGTTGTSGTNGMAGDDGLDGVDGENGYTGASGSSGNNGTTGFSGVTGNLGQSGQNGLKGTNGRDGADANVITRTNLRNELPTFDLEDLQVTSTSIGGTFVLAASNRGEVPRDTGVLEITLADSQTGMIVRTQNYSANADYWPIAFTDLNPATKYTLKLTSTYRISSSGNTDYTGIFYNRQIYTDAMGLEFKVFSATPEVVLLELTNKTSSAMSINYKITTEDGRVIKDNYTLSTNPLNIPAMTGVDSLNKAYILVDRDENTMADLSSDTVYNFSVTAIEINGSSIQEIPDAYKNFKFMTLKKPVTIEQPSVFVNKRTGQFELSVNKIIDPDHSIVRYRYEIYKVDESIVAGDPNVLVKTLYSTSTRGVLVAIDGVQVNKNDKYRFKAVAETNDNLTTVEYDTVLSDSFTMDGFGEYPSVAVISGFAEDQMYPNKINATLQVRIPKPSKLDTNKDVVISYKNPYNNPKTISFNKLALEAVETDDGSQWTYDLTFSISELEENVQYSFDVWGAIDFGTGVTQTNQLIGTVVTKLPKYQMLRARIRNINTFTETFAFAASLEAPQMTADEESRDARRANNMEYAVSQAQTIQISLYDGNVDGIIVQSPSQLTLVETIQVPVSYSPQNKKTETATFVPGNLQVATTSSFTTGFYTVVVNFASDGTEFANEIPVSANYYSAPLNASYPKVDEVSLQVNPIIKGNIDAYISPTLMTSAFTDALDKYDAYTILGYAVVAKGFDSSISLFSDVEYYCYDAEIFDNSKALQVTDSSVFYAANDYLQKIVQPTMDAKVPTAVFLFKDTMEQLLGLSYDNDNLAACNRIFVSQSPEQVAITTNTTLTRGRKYYFTYRMKDARTASYYPEILADKNVLRNITKYEAPYVTPQYHFLPYTSTTNSQTYAYFIRAFDPEAVVSKINTSFGSTPAGLPMTHQVYPASMDITDYSMLTVSGLTKGKTVSLSVSQNLYVYPALVETIMLPEAVFNGTTTISDNAGTYFTVTKNMSLNQHIFTLNFDTDEKAESVAGIEVKLTIPTQSRTIPIPINNVTGSTVVGILKWSEIPSSFINNEITISVYAYYDSGVTGFQVLEDASPRYAMQVQPVSGTGQYIKVNSTINGLKTEANASSSFFRDGAINANVRSDYSGVTISSVYYYDGTPNYKNMFHPGYISQKGITAFSVASSYFAPAS